MCLCDFGLSVLVRLRDHGVKSRLCVPSFPTLSQLNPFLEVRCHLLAMQ